MKAYATVDILDTTADNTLRVAGGVRLLNPTLPQPNFGFDFEMTGEPTKNAINTAIIDAVKVVASSYGNSLPTADVLVFCL
jgi:hypothetical protein